MKCEGITVSARSPLPVCDGYPYAAPGQGERGHLPHRPRPYDEHLGLISIKHGDTSDRLASSAGYKMQNHCPNADSKSRYTPVTILRAV